MTSSFLRSFIFLAVFVSVFFKHHYPIFSADSLFLVPQCFHGFDYKTEREYRFGLYQIKSGSFSKGVVK